MKPDFVNSVLAFSLFVAILLKIARRQILGVFVVLLPAFVFMVSNLDETNPMFAIWGLLFLVFSVGLLISDLREKGYHSVLIKFNPFVENCLLPKWLKIVLLFLAAVFGLLNTIRLITVFSQR